ncbi:unnamed protein product [Dicrocoelium dendriticum]|nr:unnamed protein product [Dicrocoelium dendriticum]
MPLSKTRNDSKVSHAQLSHTDGTHSDELKCLDFLGYDWIAAMLDNQPTKVQTPQPQPGLAVHPLLTEKENWLSRSDLFDEVAKFRRIHSDVCVSPDFDDATCNRSPQQQPPTQPHHTGHRVLTCVNQLRPVRTAITDQSNGMHMPAVYSYCLNSRLFPIPSDPESASRPPPTDGQPHILRVTVPLRHFRRPPALFYQLLLSSEEARKLDNLRPLSGLPSAPDPTSVLGTISLSAHCLVPAEPKKTTRQMRSRYDRSGLTNVSGPLHFPPGCLPRWIRSQPKTEQEAIARLLRTNRSV